MGETWRFGKGRRGDVALLARVGAAVGYEVIGIAPLMLGDEVVSSTLVRAAVEQGDLARAKTLLGRDYSVLGSIVRGRQLARQLGWPTANVEVQNELLPPTGVYAVQALIAGEWRAAVAKKRSC